MQSTFEKCKKRKSHEVSEWEGIPNSGESKKGTTKGTGGRRLNHCYTDLGHIRKKLTVNSPVFEKHSTVVVGNQN